MQEKTRDILNERGKTHGSFRDNATVSQMLKETMRACDGWSRLTLGQREALEMIAHKIGRVLAGNNNFTDHWTDIAGYASLVERELEK